MRPFTVLHIPHSSAVIPSDFREQFVLSDSDLRDELRMMTDWYTDELFALSETMASTVRYPVSRLVTDPERFDDDRLEPMAERGMGVIYTHTSNGARLRRTLSMDEREVLLARFYQPHHAALTSTVRSTLVENGFGLMIDCHSFPSPPLPCDLDQSRNRPDVCVGTDRFHTPDWLRELAVSTLEEQGFEVEIDRPYTGALVPGEFYRKEPAVKAVLIEINRRLYMDESSGSKHSEFGDIAERVQRATSMMIDEVGYRLAGERACNVPGVGRVN